MAESDKPDHWGQLASDIGAEVPPEEPQDQREEPSAEDKTEAPDELLGPSAEAENPVAEPSDRARSHEPKEQRATDWSALAEELGIEVVEEVEAVEAHTETTTEDLDATLEAPAELAPGTAVALTTETTLGSFGAGIEELTAAVEQAGSVPDAPPEKVERPLDEDARRPRRRKKRRRKPRRGEKTDTSGEAQEEVDVLEADEETVFSVAGEEPGGVEAADETESESRARGKRRRRRGKKAPRPSGDMAEGAPDQSEQDAEADKALSASAPAKPAKTKKEKPGHRKIPSWEEAVNLIIARNVEQRSKSPSGGGAPRHRGSRRGGRQKSSDKSS
jgi:hypothetical protein